MNAMLISDLAIMRKNLLQLFGVCLIVGVGMAYGTGSLIVATACISSMVPFMYLFNVAAYDELGGWQSFRLTLPLSRREIVLGRYLGVLVALTVSAVFAVVFSFVLGAVVDALPLPADLAKSLSLTENLPDEIVMSGLMGSLCVLVAATVMLPLVTKWGLTRGTRLVPVIIVLAVPLGVWARKLEAVQGFIAPLREAWASGSVSVTTVFTIGIGLALLLLAASALIAMRLYETREL